MSKSVTQTGGAGGTEGGPADSSNGGTTGVGGGTSGAGGAQSDAAADGDGNTGGTGGAPADAQADGPPDAPAAGGAEAGSDGGSVPSTVNYKSGSRLRAVVWDTQAGARWFRYWRDSQLNIDCDLGRSSDGVLRCLPRAGVLAGYADAACTQRIALPSPCYQTATKYALEPPNGPTPCAPWTAYSGKTEVYALGAQTTGPIHSMSSGTCTQYSGSAAYYPATSVVPPSTFVSAQFVDAPLGDGLSVRTAQFADGAEQRVEMVRTATATVCELETLANGTSLCIDWNAAQDKGDHFTNAQCSGDTVASAASSTCPPALVIRDKVAEFCGAGPIDSVHATGAAVASSQVYKSDGTSCGLASTSPTYFAVGAALTPPSIPELTHVQLGTGRILVAYAATAAKKPLLAESLWDSLKSRTCWPMVAPDGNVRCMWSDGDLEPAGFVDPQCSSTPLQHVWCPAVPSAVVTKSKAGGGTCLWFDFSEPWDEKTEVRGLGAAYSGPGYFKILAGQCTGPTPVSADHFLYGPIIPATDFAQLYTLVE